jgi:hypothetical protein
VSAGCRQGAGDFFARVVRLPSVASLVVFVIDMPAA